MLKVWRVMFFSALGALILLRLQHNEKRRSSLELNYITKPSEKVRKLIIDRMKTRHLNITKQIYSYDKLRRLPQDLKFILKWTKSYQYTADKHSEGQQSFIQNGCKHINCFLTHDKNLLVDHRYFDAIIFQAEQIWDIPPYFRSVHQKYIFAASSSESHHLFCHPLYDNFYNLTWTYKLNSDIRWSLITIEDKAGNVVGPKAEMIWINPMLPTPQRVVNKLAGKKKAVAWFPVSCKAPNKREKVVKAITQELEKYDLNVDTYGWCGTVNCPGDLTVNCLDLLEQEYYFYFAFENNFVVDYVSEQLLHATQHMAVPVVYGGADYSRFLPPGSYIDARKSNASVVALLIYEAIRNQKVYRNYFRWHNHYVYKSTTSKDVCKLCEILNDPSKEHCVVPNFREWWHDYDRNVCKDQMALYEKYKHLNYIHQL